MGSMHKPLSPEVTRTRPTHKTSVVVAAVVLAILTAYFGTLHVPFLLDDEASIIDNTSIRNLWAPSEVLSPPATSGTGGRPIANLSFAVSYAISGLEPWGYHVLNLSFHALVALTLYGVVRRTLKKPLLHAKFGEKSNFLAGAIAILWAVHPLQTQTVTYISQRTESLMALFFLLSLYCFIRGTEGRTRLWNSLAVVACLLGALCKEVIATLPLVVFLYDRTFIAGTFRAALRQRWRFYGFLSMSWLLLGSLLVGVSKRGVGFDLGVSSFQYALTQTKAVVHYLSLCVWPYPLIFDHSPIFLDSFAAALPYPLILGTLIATVIWTSIRWPIWGFVAGWFFIVLAPTSSVVPVTGAPIAENRPYLALAAIITLFVFTVQLMRGYRTTCVVCILLTVAGIIATVNRNAVYQSAIRLWTDTTKKAPSNYRAHDSLAQQLANVPDRQAEALTHYETALVLNPNYEETHNNLAILLARHPERRADALAHYETAVRLRPSFAKAHYNLGNLLAEMPGRQAQARAHYETALRLKPDFAEAHHNLANLIVRQPGGHADALRHYEIAVGLKPDLAEMHYNLAQLLSRLPGRQGHALTHYQTAVRLKQDFAEAHQNLAQILADQPGRQSDALAHYETALRINPNYAGAHNNYANLIVGLPGRQTDAIAHYQTALRLKPDFAEAHYNLAQLLARLPGRAVEAAAHYEIAQRLLPDSVKIPTNPVTDAEKLPVDRK